MKDIGARLGVGCQLNNMANHSSRSMPDRIADGAEDSESNSEVYSFISQNGENESENEEWANLRCSSLQTEIVSERNRRNRQRSAGYPGLAFGSSIFSSGTMMKFSIISNELHNIMNVQLKRAEGEVSALLKRIQTLEEGLGRSEESLKTASVELEEASQAINESERRRQMLEHRNITDKERMDALEDHLKEAMLMAVEAARKFDEVTET